MGKVEDLTGRAFGRLTVISRAENNKHGNIQWNCICNCEDKTEKVVAGSNLKGTTQSCGCIKREMLIKKLTTHGLSGTKLHELWKTMTQRCYNPNSKDFENYGERNIEKCECVNDYVKFHDHMTKLEHYGEKGYTIERIDNDGLYCICKNNLRWATRTEQNYNKRIQKNNKSGTNGVGFNEKLQKSTAYIGHNGKTIHLGVFENIDDAIKARKEAELKYWGKGAN